MKKLDLYNQMLEKVQKAGGYVAIPKKARPIVKTIDDVQVSVAAIFEGTDDSSPLKLITDKFIAYDVYDYLCTGELEHLLTRINK